MTAGSIRQVATAKEWEWLRFLVVGGTTYCIYVGSYFVLQLYAPRLVALTIAYVGAVSIHYAANRLFTFRAPPVAAMDRAREIARYVVLLGISYIISVTCFMVLTGPLGLPEVVGLTAGILANTAIAYLLSRVWVFGRTE